MGRIRVIGCGVVEHGEMSDRMKTLQQQRIKDQIPDTLIFVEHPEIVTIGPKAEREGGRGCGGRGGVAWGWQK